MNCKNCNKPKLISLGQYCSDKECNRARCREYYKNNLNSQRKRVLENYHKWSNDPDKKARIQEINRKAHATKRFGKGNREKVLKRDGNKCRFCGDETNLIHHLDVKGRNVETPNNTLDNLVCCCKKCHAEIHLLGRKLKMKI